MPDYLSSKILQFALALLATSSTMQEIEAEDQIPVMNSTALIDPLHRFGSQLFLKTRNSDQNVILSPLSVHQALNLVLLGVDHSSQTESELLAALGYVGSTKQTDYHEAYKSINHALKEVKRTGQKALEVYKAKSAANKEATRFDQHIEKPTIIDNWNTVIVKNKAEFKPKYKEDVRRYYNSSVEHIDDNVPASKAKVIESVNKWAKEAGFQSDVLERKSLDGDFSAILMSAIRVEASWFDDFYEHEQEDLFYNFGQKDQLVKKGIALSKSDLRNAAYVEFVTKDKVSHKARYEYVANEFPKQMNEMAALNFHAINVPLKGKVKLTILEPLGGPQGPAALNKLLEGLLAVDPKDNRTRLVKALEVLDSDAARNGIDHLMLPKFKFENEIKLNAPLKAMGLSRAFSRTSAEISNMLFDKVYISDVQHNAMIELDRYGLKAAAITIVKITLLSAYHTIEPVNVHVKNPFLFVVRYDKLPLFIGQLVKV